MHADTGGNGYHQVAEAAKDSAEGNVKYSKECVLNDITNTGVMAALIGGFALSNVQATTTEFEPGTAAIDSATYLLTLLAVHACTCSALTSALLYRTVNAMGPLQVPPWAHRNWVLLLMPMAKFGMGTAAYIIRCAFGLLPHAGASPGLASHRIGDRHRLALHSGHDGGMLAMSTVQPLLSMSTRASDESRGVRCHGARIRCAMPCT